MVLKRVYFDESGTHVGSPVMTMAGYLFSDEQARLFERDWRKDLVKLGLEYAHMAECTCGNGPYKHLDQEQCIWSEKRLIEHIKRRTTFGFGVSFEPNRYDAIVRQAQTAPTAYTFCLMACVTRVRIWIEETGYAGNVVYIFEAGHQHASEADVYMQDIARSSPQVKKRYGYAGHAFLDKRKAIQLHAADMLAWQYQHYLKRRRVDGIERMRLDFKALIRAKDTAQEYDDARFEILRDAYLTGKIRLPGGPPIDLASLPPHNVLP